MSSVSKTYTTGMISFDRILIKSNISGVAVRSISVMSSDGDVYQLEVYPFEIEEDVSVTNPIRNCTAAIILVDHPHIITEEDVDNYVSVSVYKSSDSVSGIIHTKPAKIGIKNFISIISKVENGNGVVISSDVGIRGYNSSGIEILNETVRVGIGDGRQIISDKEKIRYEASTILYYKDEVLSTSSAKSKNLIIQNYDNDSIYIYSPDYIHNNSKITLSENIDIDNNNNIYIKNKDVHSVECVIRASVLDVNQTSPIIKYIGVISR